MKKFTKKLLHTYSLLEQEAPVDVQDDVSQPEADLANVPDEEIPPVEEPISDLTDEEVNMIERTRQALLINRDEIDSDEVDMIYQPVTSDNALAVNDVITSILGKSLDKTAEIEPSGHY